MVYIEELFDAFQTLQNEMRRAGINKQKMDEARAKFKAFCEQHKLPVDFSERE